MEKIIIALTETCFGKQADKVELLAASGSARKYYRIFVEKSTYIGAYYMSVEENNLFIDFSRHFLEKGLRVPKIHIVAEDKLSYIQEDLGNEMLLDVIEKERKGELLSDHLMELYKKSLSELLRFQLLGHAGLDYSHCVPRPTFDRRCILWDLNYFKYCFLRLTGVDLSEEALENDFEALTDRLCRVDSSAFMFRDVQSRNIMVKEDEVWFIDYQGGRQGALQYDVASLLYDAIVGMAEVQREELLDYYISELQPYRPIKVEDFKSDYYHFVLIRLLQAMGAFGLRGLYERKQHFIDSIRPGLQGIATLFDSGKLEDAYPEIQKLIKNLQQEQF